MRLSCAATSPTPRSARSTFPRRGRARASSPSTRPKTSARIGRRGRCWCRRRRSPGSSSTSARRCRSPKARCATSASPWPSCWRTAAISPRTRWPTSLSSLIRCRRSSTWRQLAPRRPVVCTRTCAATSPLTCGRAAAITQPPAPAPTTSLRAASATTTARLRRSRRAASSPTGTPAATSSRYGTRLRGRYSCATASPRCSASTSGTCASSRRLSAAASGRRSCCSTPRRW